MLIRIITRHKWPIGRNSLKWQQSCRYFQKIRWRVIRTEMGRSGSYADLPKHCPASAST